MKTFTIDSKNIITVHASDVWASEGAVKFQLEQELTALATAWPGNRLVEIWNNLKGVAPVSKFKDRKTAVSRIWNAIQQIEPVTASQSKAKIPPAKKGPANLKTCGESKTDRVLAALRSPSGATLKELMKVTGWQSHSVRGFLSAQVTKRMGLRVKSSKRDGERVYRLRS
jgi:hypothetical protein